ncbi:hypothetical protein AVEN_21498-1 [Araneus ventricosus]|uniref:ADAMTS/ADAMTS-like Spacer 1 domain-containing protein n=1 Tax=Araneus ventricosus TaxID=182803 RepID=A0A4Y2T0T5_ARAVE|nr:hypothetical protein AVEN_21498-1 [Araneus ventricosus]
MTGRTLELALPLVKLPHRYYITPPTSPCLEQFGSFPVWMNGGSVESGAGSIHGSSHIKNLLMNLPSLSTTRGAFSGHDSDLDRESGDASHEDDSFFPNPTRMVANSFILGKGKAENLQFEWILTDWSPCTKSCGASGIQVIKTLFGTPRICLRIPLGNYK